MLLEFKQKRLTAGCQPQNSLKKRREAELKTSQCTLFQGLPEIMVHTYINLRKGLQELDPDLTAISFIVVPAICVIWSGRHESRYKLEKQ